MNTSNNYTNEDSCSSPEPLFESIKTGNLNNNSRRPKRRYSRDNPYRLFIRCTSANEPQYYVRFSDGCGDEHCIELSKRLFEMMDTFELEDLSFLNELDNHIEQSAVSESTLHDRAIDKPPSVEEIVNLRMEHEQLHKAINSLPDIQRRRLILYYYADLTYEQIAKLERCSYPAARRSVLSAVANLRKKMK